MDWLGIVERLPIYEEVMEEHILYLCVWKEFHGGWEFVCEEGRNRHWHGVMDGRPLAGNSLSRLLNVLQLIPGSGFSTSTACIIIHFACLIYLDNSSVTLSPTYVYEYHHQSKQLHIKSHS